MKKFPAKLLLFGEHLILRGGSALAIPFHHFGGRWRKGGAPAHRQPLDEWLTYLQSLEAEETLQLRLDLRRFAKDLEAGWFFDSDIPVGYGLGSSGALCAALTFRYGEDMPSRQEFRPLKEGLAQLESFFHGSSSGTDPLISFLDTPLILSGQQIYPPLWEDHTTELLGHFFLLDSGRSRVSGPLIDWFLARSEEPVFAESVQQQLIPSSDQAIRALISGDESRLVERFRQLSEAQQALLDPMIVPEVGKHWQRGLQFEAFFLKLCGAGGGGYYLGLAVDKQATDDYFNARKLPILWLGGM